MNLEESKQRLLQMVFDKGLLTPEEYEQEYKGKYLDQMECDSFFVYISYLEFFKEEDGSVFLTLNDKMLRDREKFEKKFGIKIVGMEDFKDGEIKT